MYFDKYFSILEATAQVSTLSLPIIEFTQLLNDHDIHDHLNDYDKQQDYFQKFCSLNFIPCVHILHTFLL